MSETEEQVTLESKLAELAKARADADELRALAANTKALLEASILHVAWTDAQAEYKHLVDVATDLETQVRDLAFQRWTETDNKKPAPGVEIKVFKEIYYQATVALEYAKESLPAALQLNAKAFEAFAKAMIKAGTAAKELPFVDEYEEPRVQIAKDLPVPSA